MANNIKFKREEAYLFIKSTMVSHDSSCHVVFRRALFLDRSVTIIEFAKFYVVIHTNMGIVRYAGID